MTELPAPNGIGHGLFAAGLAQANRAIEFPADGVERTTDPMTDPVIPPEAVEDVAKAIYEAPHDGLSREGYERAARDIQDLYRAEAKLALAAALPHLRPLFEARWAQMYSDAVDNGNELAQELRQDLKVATQVGLELGRQAALEELPTPERLARETHRLKFPAHADCEPDAVDLREAARALQAIRDIGKGAEG